MSSKPSTAKSAPATMPVSVPVSVASTASPEEAFPSGALSPRDDRYLSSEDLEPLIEREIAEASRKGLGDESSRRYLGLCRVFLNACDELFEETASDVRGRESQHLPPARQASIMRLTYLRAEIDGCESLYQEVTAAADAIIDRAETGSALRQARVLALVKTTSHVLSKTLSTCSFLLSEEASIDPAIANRALVFFAKLSTLFGAAGNPGVQNQRLAEFIGLKTVSVGEARSSS